jgi:peptidyl-dipeptidase A
MLPPHRVATSEWKYATNATDFNRRRMKEQQNLAAKFECVSWRRAAKFDSPRILDLNLRRQLGRITQQGKCGLGDEKHLEVRNNLNSEIYINSFLTCVS